MENIIAALDQLHQSGVDVIEGSKEPHKIPDLINKVKNILILLEEGVKEEDLGKILSGITNQQIGLRDALCELHPGLTELVRVAAARHKS